jgi:PAS domain S-box-containing protein
VDLNQLLQQMEIVRQRALRFQERHASAAEADEPLLVDIVDELNVTLEELQVAEEELIQQNDELLQARHTAEQEQRRYRELFEFAPDAYLVTDAFGVIREANHAAYRLLEAPAGRLPGWPLTAFCATETRRYLRNTLTQMAGRLKPQTWEYSFFTSKGHPFSAELTGAPALDDAGQITAIRWLLRDVTARKAADERLRHSEARLAEAQQLALLGHWDWAVNDDAVQWSDEMYRIYGLEPQSPPMTFADFLQRVFPDDRARVSSLIEQARKTAQPFTFEHRIVRADGALRILQARGQVVQNEYGQVVRMLGTGQDVTERKEIEEEVRQLNVQLEQRVADRTRELRQANAELADSQRRLQAIFDQSLDMILLMDDTGRCVDANRAAEGLTGYPREELLQSTVFDLTSEKNAQEVWHALLQAGQLSAEYSLRPKDGSVRDVEFRAVANILPGLHLAVVRDVTQRKEMERRLQLSQARFAGIIALSEDAIISIDREQCITLINPSVERLFGYQPAELIGQPLDRLLPDRSVEVHRRHVEAFSRSPDTTRPMNERGPIYGRRKDGSEFPAEASISKFVLQGELVITVRLHDISNRVRADEALRASEQRFRVMADLSPTMVWTTAPDGTLTYANQQWLDYCGIPTEENQAGWPELVLHPDDADYRLRHWTRALHEGIEYEVEVRHRRYDGEYRWFLTRAVPTRDAAGHITAWFGTTTDIHDHRMAEEAISRLNQELDRRVEELETLLNVLPVGIAVAHDPECLEITMNPAAAKLLGVPAHENPSFSRPDADRLPFKVLRSGQQVPADELPMQYAAAHDVDLRDVELDLLRADGDQLSLLEYASPLHDAHDQVRGCLGVFVDITARKLAERRLSLQYAVAHALAESIGVSEAAQKVLKAVCEITNSEFGSLWNIDRAAGLLHNVNVWQSAHLDGDGFAGITRSTPFNLDEGLPGRVISTGLPLWIPDMAIAGLPRTEAATQHGLHSAFAVPVRSQGEITGVLECFSRDVREPDADFVNMLDAVGHQVGLFMERKQAEDELAIRAHQQAIVAEVGQRALSGIPLEELLNEAVAHVSLTLGVGFAGITELNREVNGFVLRAGVGWNEEHVGQAVISSGPDSVPGYTLAGNDPVIIEDLTGESRFPDSWLLREHGVVSGLSISIPGHAGPFGVLGAYSSKRHVFSADDVHFMQAIAHALALAMERTRAEEALLLSRTEIAAILNGVADGISAINKDGKRIYANAALARLLRFESVQEFMTLPVGQLPAQFDIYDETGQPLSQDRYPGQLALQGIRTDGLVARYRFQSTGDEIWTMLKSQPVFNEAGQVVMAVNIVQDITELKHRELAQRLLAEAGALLTKSLDYPSRLQNLTEIIVPRIADWCAIDVLDEQGVLQRMTVKHLNPDKTAWGYELFRRFPPDPDATNSAYNVVRTGQPQFVPYIVPEMFASVTDPEVLEVLDQLQMQSALVVPLTARGRSLGVMSFVWAESGHHYTLADLELAQELARRAALALDNARLYAEAQRLNVELEQRVLQRTTEVQAANVRLNAEIAERRQAEEEVRRLNVQLEGRVQERTLQLERTNDDLQREIVDRKHAERTLRLTLQKTHELYTLSQHISLVRSPEEVLQVLLSSSYLKYTTRASVAVFDSIWQDNDKAPKGCTILTAWNREPDTQLYIGQHLSLEDYGLVPPFSRSEVLFISDLRKDPRVSQSMRQRLLSLRTASSLLFPLVAGGEWYGMLSLHFRFVEMMSSEDIPHLRGLVDEAAMAIYNFQLLENEARARLEAEHANNLKLKFLAMISHELRTPLASIKGFAGTLLASDVTWQPESQREFIGIIDTEADRLAELIEQLLDLSRIEAGTLRISPRVETWERILAAAESQLQALTVQHRLVVQAPPVLPSIKADSIRISQVITNLVSNASKYSPPQSAIILTIASLDEREVKISVSDEGSGIPPEAHGRIFEAFQQLGSGRNDARGAGLGLAICRGLIEAHGGRIWVDTHEGPGSTLSFTLPAA